MPLDIFQKSIAFHKKHQGKISTKSVIPLKTKSQLSTVYTPGIAGPAREIAKNPSLSFDLTWRGRAVAIISDGSAVLGIGNVGPEAALPVMEGKAMLMKDLGGVDAVPIVINTQDSKEIIKFIRYITPSFAGINLEDISAPRCFEIEEELQDLGIPVFHDDQHATAIITKASLQNAAKAIDKPFESLRVVVVGAGAAGIAISKLLLGSVRPEENGKITQNISRVKDLIVVDSDGALYQGRSNMNRYKQNVANASNRDKKKGSLAEVIKGADVVIGVASPKLITPAMVKSMAKDPIVFALSNPTPEIMPDEAKAAGAAIVATGRSDFPNQINNASVFPGIFRAVIKGRLKVITNDMKLAAADALASLIKDPAVNNIAPHPLQPGLAEIVAKAVLKHA